MANRKEICSFLILEFNLDMSHIKWFIEDYWIYPKEHWKLELTAIFMKQDEHKHDENAKE